jgi:phosphomethylpyrimidine synthase
MEMTEPTYLDWEKQIALSIDPGGGSLEFSRTGQRPGNNVPCTMWRSMRLCNVTQQRKYEEENYNKFCNTFSRLGTVL